MVFEFHLEEWNAIRKIPRSVFYRMNANIKQVNWPKLNPRPWATEGYQEAISNVRKDKVIGSLVARHDRNLSTARYTNAEEGKKRIE